MRNHLWPQAADRSWFAAVLMWLAALLAIVAPGATHAQETVCAVVKIEIRQELTLERQAFEARMKITNGLDTLALEDVDIDVYFEDEAGNPVLASSDPNDLNAKFFIRLDSMTGVDDVNGNGLIPPKGVAEITWLIIPARGAGGTSTAGVMYGVGATLTYLFGGTQEVVRVTPDVIRVKPMPALTLDYFLPRDVFADDPMTAAEEPAEPFDLGVRVLNSGAGAARSVKIESAQPKIIDNQQGLLVNFELLGTLVGDAPRTNTLLADFGDIEAGRAQVARWIMTSSLSGQFISFEADFVHADELGGQMTSLITGINTHELVRSVRVDLPGRDAVRDFLAIKADGYRVYESEGLDAPVTDASSGASLVALGVGGGQTSYRLTHPSSTGLTFVRVADPQRDMPGAVTVWRSDGKRIEAANAWRYRAIDEQGNLQHYIGVFDSGSTGQYELRLEGEVASDQPPTIGEIGPFTVAAGDTLTFTATATDPDGEAVALSASGLPTGASFVDQGSGAGRFEWAPTTSQLGNHSITITATAGAATATRAVLITVDPPTFDTDLDGLNDDWEREHFGDLSRDGTGDYDRDSATDRQEFDHGGDPRWEDRPGRVLVESPQIGEVRSESTIDFIFENAPHATTAEVDYLIEVLHAADPAQVLASAQVAEEPVETMATLAAALDEDQQYLWRIGADDGATSGDWRYGEFLFSATDGLASCQPAYPSPDQTVGETRPQLAVMAGADPEGHSTRVRFEVATDAAFAQTVATSPVLTSNAPDQLVWTIYPALANATSYYWRATLIAADGTSVACGGAGSFVVDDSLASPSGYAFVEPIADQSADPTRVVVASGHAPSAALTYRFELDEAATFDSAALLVHEVLSDAQGRAEWAPPVLSAGRTYWLRAQATADGRSGRWIVRSFRTSAATSAPPVLMAPRADTWVSSTRPLLTVGGGALADRSVDFEVYGSSALTTPLAQITGAASVRVPAALEDRRWYWWRARHVQSDGTAGAWTDAQRFFVIDDGVDSAPVFAWRSPTQDIDVRPGVLELSWTLEDDDGAEVALYRDVDALGEDGTLITDGLTADGIGRYSLDAAPFVGQDVHLYAVVTDASHSAVHRAAGVIRVTAPSVGLTSEDQQTSEAGDAGSIDVLLSMQPDAQVIVSLSSSDTGEAALSTAELVFGPSDWDQPQRVTVLGIDDDVDDGPQDVRISAEADSDDPMFDGLSLELAGFANVDDDSAGIMLTAAQAPVVTGEDGTSASLSVALTSQPEADVRVMLAVSDSNEGEVSPSELLFTPANWRQAQYLTLRGLDDSEVDWDIEYQLQVADVVTDDVVYQNVHKPSVAATNLDDERVALVVSPSDQLEVGEDGKTDVVRVALNARPAADVRVAVAATPDGVVSLTTNELVFTPDNWSLEQSVTLVGIDDGEDAGDRSFSLHVGSTSSADARFDQLMSSVVPGINVARYMQFGVQVDMLPASDWQPGTVWRVPLAAVFEKIPVIVPTWVSADPQPYALRVVAVTKSYFEVVLLRPDGSESVSTGELAFLAADPGDRRLPDGRRIVVGKVSSSQPASAPGGWASVQFGVPFAQPPVLLAHLQTAANGVGGPAAPWLTSAVGIVTGEGTQLALEPSETPVNGALAEEVIGFVALSQAAHGAFMASGEQVEYESQWLANRVDGIETGCTAVTHAATRAMAPVVFATKLSRDATDGGWARVCDRDLSTVALAIDEDDVLDPEREQSPGAMGVLTFSRPFAIAAGADVVGVLIDQRFGLATYEDGLGTAFGVRLSAPPTTTVNVPIATGSAALSASNPTLVFDASNWSTTQWVRLDPAASSAAKLSAQFVTVGTPISQDARYAALPAQRIDLQVGAAGSWSRVIDNRDPMFSTVGQGWALSSSAAGFVGVDYATHVANGQPSNAVVVDNTGVAFSLIGEWQTGSGSTDQVGSDYRYRSPGDPPSARIFDDLDAELVGKWQEATSIRGYIGRGYQRAVPNRHDATALWTFPSIEPGEYRIFAHWTSRDSHAPDAPYTITHTGGQDVVKVDQRINGGAWMALGTYRLDAASSVQLAKSRNGHVIADAIKLIPIDAVPNTAVWEKVLPTSEVHEVFVRWPAHPQRASNAPFFVEHAEGTAAVTVDQSQQSGVWVSLGRYPFDSLKIARVRLVDQADDVVVADAVRFIPEKAAPNSASWALSGALGSYDVLARWPAAAEHASNTTFAMQSLLGGAVAVKDQRMAGGQWQPIGEAVLAPDLGGSVTVTDRTDGLVVADAIRLDHRAAAGPAGSRIMDDVLGRADGEWSIATAESGAYAETYRWAASGSGEVRFVWNARLPRDRYRVYARWPGHDSAASNAPFEVMHVEGATVVSVNQQQTAGAWVLLGTFELDTTSSVALSDQADGHVVADAVRFEPARYPERAR